MKEQDIIQGCKQGNRLAQKCFVEEYSSYIYAIVRRYIKRDDVATDCVQDTLIHVLKKIDKYTEKGKFKGWLSRVTVNKCIESIRKEKKHLTADLEHVAEPLINENSNLSLEYKDIMKFLDTLPQQYKMVINLYLVEGYSHKEIGQKLNITESSSRSLLSRGRKMIQNSFREEGIVIVHNARKKNIG